MSGKLFIDTWGWIVLFNKRESRHKEVDAFYRKFRLEGGRIFTSDYVLDETFTLLFKRVPEKAASEALQHIHDAYKEGYIECIRILPPMFEKTVQLRLKLSDKPNISFTDLTSMLVMKEQGISTILSDDTHFLHVGMGFQHSV
jgi:predicted nucleic acid-binding protein